MSTKTPLTRYQWKLFAFLSVACFWEGYDFFALAQILPNLRAYFDLSESAGGALVAAINIGTILAYLLVRKADKWGRRQMLMVTIVGYTIFSFLSAFAWDVYSFAFFQLVARVFLIAEWATTMVYAAEEFPADRRGMVIGVIQACNSVGAVMCAGVVPLLLKSPGWLGLGAEFAQDGWRSVYLIGVVPLLIIMVWRRGLKESRRFVEQGPVGSQQSMFKILKTPHLRRVLLLAVIWMCTYVCTQTAITFWKEFAVAERGMTDADVGASITIAAVVSSPLIFFAGKIIDVLGRKKGSILLYLSAAIAVVGCYQFTHPVALTIALAFGIFGTTSVLPVLNAYNTELFPTQYRGDAFAWSNNLLGRIGYVTAPLVVGVAAETVGWSTAVSATALGPIIALALILGFLPETKGKELEETASV